MLWKDVGNGFVYCEGAVVLKSDTSDYKLWQCNKCKYVKASRSKPEPVYWGGALKDHVCEFKQTT